ncbi:MAG: DNA repair protein RecN [Candidatus Sumerlaeaceae bacterium]|nr:DNA repair protein RecN [Candidatus Sumerlaeaceae bacterium]
MLELLRIKNYAIIDDLEVELGSGLTVITGETGAGKSIVMGALKLALGERATAESIRSGEKRAFLEAVFGNVADGVQAWLAEAGLDDPDNNANVSVRREIQAGGSSRSFINGRAATLVQVRQLGEWLVDIHSQNEHTTLFESATQLRLLDSFGGHAKELNAYKQAFEKFRVASASYVSLTQNQGDSERRRSFLDFQIKEIDAAKLSPGEEEPLETERRRLMNAERLGKACAAAADLIYEGEQTESPAGGLIAAAAKLLAEVASLDPSQQGLVTQAEELRFATEDLAARVRDYAEKVAADPQRLVEVEERLQTIRDLKRKYGGSIDEVLATLGRLTAELYTIENHGAALKAAEAAVSEAQAGMLKTARALSAVRQASASKFQKLVEKEMRELELPKAVFQTGLIGGVPDSPAFKDSCGVTGADEIDFLIGLNPGEPARPLRKVASGGEISRIMLAIKSILADRDETPTLIFDEIDVGISGEAAARVGEKLRRLGRSHQVLCITHLPQIAAGGNQHLVVSKKTEKGRVRVTVSTLGQKERSEALAQMLSGREINAESRKFAEKLLEQHR